METLLIELTPEQEEKLFPLFEELEDCGAVFAQLYIDGVMRVRLFTPEIAANVEQVLGSPECGFAPSAYGREVHKEKQNVVQQRDELLKALEKIADDGIENSRDPRTLIAKAAIAKSCLT